MTDKVFWRKLCTGLRQSVVLAHRMRMHTLLTYLWANGINRPNRDYWLKVIHYRCSWY